MPTVHVVWLPRDTDTKRRVAQSMAEVLIKEAKCDPQAVSIIFHDTPMENFSRAGVLMPDRDK